MVFHVRITMIEVHKKPSRAIIAIGETIVLESDGKQSVLTSGISRKYTEISYSLDVCIILAYLDIACRRQGR
jgi:hypothetical protein